MSKTSGKFGVRKFSMDTIRGYPSILSISVKSSVKDLIKFSDLVLWNLIITKYYNTYFLILDRTF